MKMKGSDIIINLLMRQGIDIVAGIPGGANLPLYHALGASPIRHVLARHEQGAAFIAQGMARSTGRAAVCFTTSGPGVTNALTALADARADSVPIVVISGQVPTGLIGTDAFQEVDACGMSMPVAKHAFLVRSGPELLAAIPRAFAVALSGRPGPVLVDIPKDIQQQEIEFHEWPQPGKREDIASPDPDDLARAAEAINKARNPVICAGGGVISSGASSMLRQIAERRNIPVATTLMGIGSIPAKHPLCLGLFGMHGSRAANDAIDGADLVVAMGLRFNDRTTGKVSEFCSGASIVHFDIDRCEINKIKKATLPVQGDLLAALKGIESMIEPGEHSGARFESVRNDDYPLFRGSGSFSPAGIIRAISAAAGTDAIVTTDVGQHQMWVAQHYPFTAPRTFLTSGGLGTMGFGLPAAIGAALANPGKKIVCMSGDGSVLMNIQELAALSENRLNVVLVIFNNGHLGLVRQQQELFYGGRIVASSLQCRPDFPALAESFGIQGLALRAGDDPARTLAAAFGKAGPVLIDVPIDAGEMVFPMVPPGAANRDMIGHGARSA